MEQKVLKKLTGRMYLRKERTQEVWGFMRRTPSQSRAKWTHTRSLTHSFLKSTERNISAKHRISFREETREWVAPCRWQYRVEGRIASFSISAPLDLLKYLVKSQVRACEPITDDWMPVQSYISFPVLVYPGLVTSLSRVKKKPDTTTFNHVMHLQDVWKNFQLWLLWFDLHPFSMAWWKAWFSSTFSFLFVDRPAKRLHLQLPVLKLWF